MQVFVFQPIPLTYIGMKSKLLQHKKPKYYYFFVVVAKILFIVGFVKFGSIWISFGDFKTDLNLE